MATALAAAYVALQIASCGDEGGPRANIAPASPTGSDGAGAGEDAIADASTLGDAPVDARKPLVNTCRDDDAAVVPDTWFADPRLCLTVLADRVVNPRQIAFAPNGDLFVIANTQVLSFVDTNHDGVIEDEERMLFTPSLDGVPPFTHNVVFSPDGAFVYVANMTTIYRWAYHPGDRVAGAAAEVVVKDMPSDGHDSRTIVFDDAGRLYVNVGSLSDFDYSDSGLAERCQVRRFLIPATLPAGGIAYSTGEIFASGLRNDVGLTIDSRGRVWGVENGVDPLGDDNPAEELNRLDSTNRFFGHPYCYSEYKMDGGLGTGAQWHLPSSENPKDDTWCREPKNVQRPAGVMPAHWAPLGITEYPGGSLPWEGDLLIASHGSFFRTTNIGRVIARARLDGDAVLDIKPVVGHLVDGGLEEGTWETRPVDVRVGPEAAVYISDTQGNRLLRLGYRP